jgi:hypothetical protein
VTIHPIFTVCTHCHEAFSKKIDEDSGVINCLLNLNNEHVINITIAVLMFFILVFSFSLIYDETPESTLPFQDEVVIRGDKGQRSFR